MTAEDYLKKHTTETFVHGEPLRGQDFIELIDVENAKQYAIMFAIEQLQEVADNHFFMVDNDRVIISTINKIQELKSQIEK